MIYAQYVGWLLTLATVMIAVKHIMLALLKLIWEQGSQLNLATSEDAFRTTVFAAGDLLKVLKLRWFASTCSAVMWLTLLLMGVEGFAAFGFAAMTFVIAGLATPSALQIVRPLSNVLQKAKQKAD